MSLTFSNSGQGKGGFTLTRTSSGGGLSLSTTQTSVTASAWEILLRYNGKKISTTDWTSAASSSLKNSFASLGTSGFKTGSATNTGANLRTQLGNGVGLYNAFFTKTNISRVAFVDGTSNSTEPTTHTNYLIYDLVQTNVTESFYGIINRLDSYLSSSAAIHGNDTVWTTASVANLTAGANGYSGLLVASGGNDFKTTTLGMVGLVPRYPDKFVVMGINFDSDNDIQALCAFSGSLAVGNGKGDSWRVLNPAQTFWSYWGDDFYTDSRLRGPSRTLQTTPGVATGASYTGSVYLLAY